MQHKMASLLRLVVLSAVFFYSDGNPLSRIIGGNDIEIESVAWQASLRRQGSHSCGASFIHNKWLVTAAHCVDGANVNDLTVGYGHKDKREHDAKAVSVLRYIMHPDFSNNGNLGYPNDVALLELTSPVLFDNKTNKVDLPQSNNPLTNCAITGWGCTDKVSIFCVESPNFLQGTFITKIQPDECKNLWSDQQIQDIHVCVNDEGKSACNGDSGGPLSCHQDGGIVLAGATSWGSSSCAGRPSVYARISVFTNWIKTTVNVEL